jgi:hypothetical protein
VSAGAGGGLGAGAVVEDADVGTAFGCCGEEGTCVARGVDEADPADGDGVGVGEGVGAVLGVGSVVEVGLGSALLEGAAEVAVGLAGEEGDAAGLAEAGSGARELALSRTPSTTSRGTR